VPSMSKEEILAKLKPVIAEQLGVDEAEVKEDASFTEDLNADSLDLVELIMSLEEQFKMQISDEDAEKLTTVGEAVEFIYEHTN
jgi:acyl carrier protein